MTEPRRTDFDSELQRHNEVLRRASAIQLGERILDIGCGDGLTTREAAIASGAGRALGIDISVSAVGRALAAAGAARIANIDFQCADAQTHPFASEHFDVAISRFGTMFFADPAAAFANIRGALRPGGRMVMIVWQARERNEWIMAIDRALEAEGAPSAPASDRLNPFSLADPVAVTALLEQAGFADVAFSDVDEAVCYGVDVAAALEWILGFSYVQDLLRGMDAPGAERAVGRLRALLATHLGDDGVWLDSRAWIVSARRPAAVAPRPEHASAQSTSGELLLPVDGISICAQTFGAASAPAVLLISGAESSMDWWDDAFCALLAEGGRYVVRYDTRDTGRSTTFPPGRPPYDGDALIDDAIGVLDGLGIRAAHVVGISMGGGIAQVLAVRHPERVASLTLIATSSGGPGLPPMSTELSAQMGDGGEPDWTDREAVIAYYIAGEHMLAGSIPVDEERMRRIIGHAWDRSPAIASGQNHWQLGGESVHTRLGEIEVPALVLHGTEDPLFPFGHAEALARGIAGARLLPLTGKGHQMPPPDLWDTVVAAILEITSGAAAGRIPAP